NSNLRFSADADQSKQAGAEQQYRGRNRSWGNVCTRIESRGGGGSAVIEIYGKQCTGRVRTKDSAGRVQKWVETGIEHAEGESGIPVGCAGTRVAQRNQKAERIAESNCMNVLVHEIRIREDNIVWQHT